MQTRALNLGSAGLFTTRDIVAALALAAVGVALTPVVGLLVLLVG